MKIIYTDVLVIGGGLAGLRIGIGAKRRGHDVIILSLVPPKRSHSAAAQGGMHPNGRATYGHSMLVDPWGGILAEHASGPGVVIGDVDAARTAEVRRKLPAYAHRRLNAQRETSTNSPS